MRTHPVYSSNIAEAGYDPQKKVLAFVFKSSPDTLYFYANVPAKVFMDMLQAPSLGKFFAKVIKPSGTYSVSKTKRQAVVNG